MKKLLRYTLAIALPPVSVFLNYGFSLALLINVPLTILGWLPGSIHAVWAIAKQDEKLQQIKVKSRGIEPTPEPIEAEV